MLKKILKDALNDLPAEVTYVCLYTNLIYLDDELSDIDFLFCGQTCNVPKEFLNLKVIFHLPVRPYLESVERGLEIAGFVVE